jgi:hypothetical protein
MVGSIRASLDNYFGRANLYYQNSDYPVLQCVLPDSKNRFPDQLVRSYCTRGDFTEKRKLSQVESNTRPGSRRL